MLSDTSNPYAFATSSSEPQIPTYKLYDSGAVALASFLGGPVPGTILMALNYRRLGRPNHAVLAGLAGVSALVGAVLLGNLLPHGTTTGLGIGLSVATWRTAQTLQGHDIDQHINRGGQLASRWAGTGIGSLFLCVFLALIFWPEMIAPKKIAVGNLDVYYSGSATQSDAHGLADGLTKIGFVPNSKVSVFLAKSKNDAPVLSFVVQDGFWNRPSVVLAFGNIAQTVAPTLGGYPLKVRLINGKQEVEKEYLVAKKVMGTDENLCYFGTATEAEATALGEVFQHNQYLLNRPWDVFLTKGSGGTTISIVTTRGWDDPAKVAIYESLVRDGAPAVGGLPVRLQMLDTNLEIQKEEMVR
jgi:hypothetical protein